MTLICPICHSRNSVEAAILTEAGQAYTRLLLRQPDWLRFSLARYILLFAPAAREMAYDRRLRLAEETLALDADPRRLAAALAETVEAIMAKRVEGDIRPLTNHRYLQKVLAGLPGPVGAPLAAPQGEACLVPTQSTGAPKGKRRLAMEVLAAWAGEDWLRGEICHGLQALLANPALRDAPAADTVEYTAGLFETVLRARVNIPEVDSGRVEAAFKVLLGRRLERWPEPADVLAELPRRPERQKLAEPLGEEARQKGKEFFSKMAGGGR